MVPYLSYRGIESTIAPENRESNMSGVSFLTAVKTFTPGGRRRRRCDKQQKLLELPPMGHCSLHPDVVPTWDTATPITPPADFLPPGYKKGDKFSGLHINNKSIIYSAQCLKKYQNYETDINFNFH